MEKTSNKPFYITTTLPYVNGRPHLGYALEVVQADVLARVARESGSEVVFNIGTDEHGQKIYQKAVQGDGKNIRIEDEFLLHCQGWTNIRVICRGPTCLPISNLQGYFTCTLLM
jgi:valyl-tRNA synthetase